MKFNYFHPRMREFYSVFSDSFKLFAVVHLGLTYGYSFSFCVGPSMLPTINEKGDMVFIDHFSHSILQKDYKRGDVVICISPYDRKKNVCKRITAVEGDVIPIRSQNFPFMNEVIVVPRGHVWLAGDNPQNSTDSRQYGPVSMGLIQGRVISKLSTGNFWENPFALIPSGPPPYLKKVAKPVIVEKKVEVIDSPSDAIDESLNVDIHIHKSDNNDSESADDEI